MNIYPLIAAKAGAYASWKVDDVDKIEKTDGSVTYVIEVESGEKRNMSLLIWKTVH